jgi:hypothetical protein
MKGTTIFWHVTPCSLLEVRRHFEGKEVSFYRTSRCHISDDNNLLTHRCDNLIPQMNGYSQVSELMYFTSRCGSHVISMYCTNTSQIKHYTKALHIVLINKYKASSREDLHCRQHAKHSLLKKVASRGSGGL